MADGLLTTLSKLLKHGSIAWSAVSAKQREALRPLLDGGVLARERSGAGERVVARKPDVLRRFAENQYPSGLDEAIAADRRSASLSPAEGVQHFRDAKRGSQQADVLALRGTPGSVIQCDEFEIPVGELTEKAGAASVVLTAGREVSMNGTLAIIENQTAFLHAEALGVAFDVALYAGGRLSERVMRWLASPAMTSAHLVYCPDYDPVGLQEYGKLHARCGQQVRLYRPPDLEELLRRYGKPKLYRDNQALLASMGDAPSEVKVIARLLERYGCGLEQEVLIRNQRRKDP